VTEYTFINRFGSLYSLNPAGEPHVTPNATPTRALEQATSPAHFPREIAPGLFWFGCCLEVSEGSKILHNHNSCFLMVGSKATVLIDTAMPFGWRTLKRELAEALRGRPLDYVFPTHPEGPHMGNIGPLVETYPELRIVGDLRNYHLYYPRDEHRFVTKRAGDVLDLGDRQLQFVRAIVHDLPNTLWGYNPDQGVLFVSDAYPYTHDHEADQCIMTSEELPAEIRPEDTSIVIGRALNWARHLDGTHIMRELRAFLDSHKVNLIAPAHGGVITNPREITRIFELGLERARTS
jgi:flavorubredoxin